MVAVDSSTWIAYVQGEQGADIRILDASLAAGNVAFPLVALTEILSQPALPAGQRTVLLSLPTMQITDGYWIRAAASRAAVLAHGLRARLAGALIAQSCIDHDAELVTRDGDFRHFAKHCGLQLA
jgi:predicted nucleic acid-binding protein